MEVAVPPLAVAHANNGLFRTELRPDTRRRTAGRAIADMGFFQDGDAKAALRQPDGTQRSGCPTPNNHDMLCSRCGHTFTIPLCYSAGDHPEVTWLASG